MPKIQEKKFGDPINTVGEMIRMLSAFPKDMPVRFSVLENFNSFSPNIAFASNALHQYGVVCNDIWSDGCGTDTCVQVPIMCGNEITEDQLKHIKYPQKYHVSKSENDPDGEGTYH